MLFQVVPAPVLPGWPDPLEPGRIYNRGYGTEVGVD